MKSPSSGEPIMHNLATHRRFLTAIALLTGLPVAISAQTLQQEPVSTDPAQLFQWELSTETAGDTTWVAAVLEIAPHHHVYAERTAVEVEEGMDIWAGEPIATEPEMSFDQFEGREMAKYKGRAEFRVPVLAYGDGGERPVRVTLKTQGCSETTCYFPGSEEHTIQARVVPQGNADIDVTPDTTSGIERALSEGSLLLALGIMFIGGVLTSFTPCVYPLIPITVAFFGATRTKASKSFLLSIVFVLGMATMYSALGVGAAATGAVFGTVLTNPVVVTLIAVIFLVFAASMFGAFKIQLPTSMQMRLNTVGGAGYGGSFLAGLAAGVIAAPCTGPVLGAALTYVATTGDLQFGFMSMFAFALGMGLLFILVGTFSARAVPRSGRWLRMIESLFGVIMVVAALYFLREIIPSLKQLASPGTTALVVSIVLAVLGIAVGALHKRFTAELDAMGEPEPEPSATERLRKAVGVVLMVAGLFGVVGYFTAPVNTETVASLPQPEWVHDEAQGLALAREQGTPVMIDFYADWCAACKELDHFTYSHPDVLERLDRFVSIKLDFTAESAWRDSLTAKYRVVGLPTVIFLDSRGNEVPGTRIQGFLPADKFLRKTEPVE